MNPFNLCWHADLALRRVDDVNVCVKPSTRKAILEMQNYLCVLSIMDKRKLILTFLTLLNTRSHQTMLCGIYSKLSIK
jgi:hypothetical protein